MTVILGYTLEELREEVVSLGLERYRADQILNWVYKKGVTDFSLMTNISKRDRQVLAERFSFHTLQMIDKVEAPDSVKYLFKTEDGHTVETVLIKERDHLTLCVSSQVGCAVGCSFCATARDGLLRNLRTEEIIDQFIQVQKDSPQRIRNVVFMGMGEPLANYENVRKAVKVMISPWGLDLSKRRVSVSTSGIISQLKKMAQDPVMRELNLAVSINAPSQELRERIMPISKTNPLHELMEVLYQYPYPPDRRIMLEYVLIEKVNDEPEHALQLAQLLKGNPKKFKVNLIPYNPDPELPYRRPPLERVYRFQKILWDNGISTFVRFSKGVQVFGACGQLRSRRTSVVKW
ncbi:radical SAM enzyme, Cfr family [Thermocrinis albus DSM 14484]|uniref:Probable dual-specificity RNA methyltransferase RlmN n=1 Tax=Thermocrinis albus (strain DSM 14484 / JCM 11386 / HI 11/12) TaxID=638303 RepID=D3SQD0_THEAH|nr:23S rRNA (adenine(2503)-C(2))-methyltransferase RlmN [Thermocrinis albus]ADC89367.1 radical SAM enzyme, Cfr family [Thermocrinis albus DSM 14484]